jgi:dihydrofolate reductase
MRQTLLLREQMAGKNFRVEESFKGVPKMGKVVIHATITLDGYIAGLDDDLSWMAGYVGPDRVADEVIRNVGAIVSGGRLFPLIEKDPDGSLPYGGAVKAPVFVLTHHPRETVVLSGVTFHFVTESFESAVRQAKAAAGEQNVMLFGATMAQLIQRQRVLSRDIASTAIARPGAAGPR